MTDMRKLWMVAIGYWLITSALCCLLYPLMITDTITRYAPMADHFARGDWYYSFHPRFGVLFQVLTGLTAKILGVAGDNAAQIVSIGMLSLSVVPLWIVVRHLFDVRIAWWAVALTLFSDDFSRYALDGLRDTGKCLGFALIGLGFVRAKSLAFACGLLILVTLASYCFAVSSVLLLGWCIYWLVAAHRNDGAMVGWRMYLLPIGFWLVGSAAVIGMTHAYTGHWLPSPHYIKLLGGWL